MGTSKEVRKKKQPYFHHTKIYSRTHTLLQYNQITSKTALTTKTTIPQNLIDFLTQNQTNSQK